MIRESVGRSSNSRGSTLVEMLVGTCLLGIFLITVGALMHQSINVTADNIYRQRAGRLGSDVAEILRGVSAAQALQHETPAIHDCVNTICSPEQFLQMQLNGWQRRAANELPEGTLDFSVTRTGGTASALVTVGWHAGSGQIKEQRLDVTLVQ